VKQELVDRTQDAVDRGAFGIPTFFIGKEMWFGKERLGQIEEYLAGSTARP
jgi:2-hydroxychromene-2-carboxylate isomerase